LGDPATNDLAEADRRCVLQAGVADHHDVAVLWPSSRVSRSVGRR
jgi:hypothetical protein